MSDRLNKTIQRFQAKVDSGSFYEAHQTLRTITNRYVKSKQYKEARDLLYQGSSILIKNKEYASAADLINYLIQIYEEEKITITDTDSKLKLIELISNLPNNDPSLNDLAKTSINWSIKSPECSKFGDNDLHHLFGTKLLNSINDETDNEKKLNKFAIAELHLVLGTFESIPIYTNFLVEVSKSNPSIDPGVFLSRAILNYSYLKNINFVKEAQSIFFKNILIESESINDEVLYTENQPLLNFLQLLTLVLQKEPQTNSQKFLKLFNNYKGELKKYEILTSVEYLGKLYFNLNIGNSGQSNNMLANFMSGLLK
ncbi:uncharacterized protein KGF55_005727 [Candida pseudojiufengensis]|uniref:uncharacterized protein n=1 Tax=Candida pseudojiufengensis TaxID=497109 RepID=UPI002225633E|nr:uncharacterized protein KGF55_005727 [Candida pseudojiufengensis]KAI5958729.1 hypothetical protein KGF55_005727 [Candida pseudojiufengensis]